MRQRLRQNNIRFTFVVQRYLNEARTPLEDGTAKWDTPLEAIAELIIPQQELTEAQEAEVEKLNFTPWHLNTEDFEPLGSLNRARKRVYAASAGLRREAEKPDTKSANY